MDFGDSSAMDRAANKGTPVDQIPLEGTGSSKGENFLDTPIHTPPQSKSPSLQPFHHGWATGRGRGMGRKGPKSSTIIDWMKMKINIIYIYIVFRRTA